MANESNIKDELKVLFKEHDYNKTYSVLSVVTYKVNDDTCFYQAIRNVPRGISIKDNSYWKLLNKDSVAASNNEPITPDEPDEPTIDYLKIKADQSLVLSMEGGSNNKTIEWSNDNGRTWSPFNTPLYIEENYQILFRGDKGYQLENAYFVVTSQNSDSDSQPTITVTGDLQTLLSKDLIDSSIYSVGTLFSNVILSADTNITCSGTYLTPGCFRFMFANQPLLKNPMELPNLSYSSFSVNTGSQDDYYLPFYRMYADCTSLTKMFDIPNKIVNNADSDEYKAKVLNCFKQCLLNTTFDVTSDNGETLNFECNISFEDVNSKAAFCKIMGNINGFPPNPFTVQLSVVKTQYGYTRIKNLKTQEEFNNRNTELDDSLDLTFIGDKNSMDGSILISLTADCLSQYRDFAYWYHKTGSDEWTILRKNWTFTLEFTEETQYSIKPYFSN